MTNKIKTSSITNQQSSKKTAIKDTLTTEEIESRCSRYMNILHQQDLEAFISRNEKEPYDNKAFNEDMFRMLKKRHLENNKILQDIEEGFDESFPRLSKAYDDVPHRLKKIRSGDQKFGPTRVRNPLKQRDVAFCIRIWEQNYQKIEAGKLGMSLDVLIRLCSFYKVPADIILFGYHPFGAPKASTERLEEKDRIIQDLRDLVEMYKEKLGKK